MLLFKLKGNKTELRVIALLLIVELLNEGYSTYLKSIAKENFLNYNVFVLIETYFLYFFFYLLFTSPIRRKAIYLSSFLFIIVWITYFRKSGLSKYGDQAVLFQILSVIAFSILYFYDKLTTQVESLIYNEPIFWVVVAYLISCSGTLFYYLFISKLPAEEQLRYDILRLSIALLKYVLLSIAMLIYKEVPPPSKKFQLT